MRTAGVEPHLAEPAETSVLRGPKGRAKTDKADAQLLRQLLADDRAPECYIPPPQVLDLRARLQLYHDLRTEHTSWAKRIHATCFHHGTTTLGEAGVTRDQVQRRITNCIAIRTNTSAPTAAKAVPPSRVSQT